MAVGGFGGGLSGFSRGIASWIAVRGGRAGSESGAAGIAGIEWRFSLWGWGAAILAALRRRKLKSGSIVEGIRISRGISRGEGGRIWGDLRILGFR